MSDTTVTDGHSADGIGLDLSRPSPDTLLIRVSGSWSLQRGLPATTEVEQILERSPRPTRVAFDGKRLAGWDSSLLTFMNKVMELCSRKDIATELNDLPVGLQNLLALATAVPEREGAGRDSKADPFFAIVGKQTLALIRSAGEFIEFIGEAALAFGRLARGRARFRRSDLVLIIQESGANALPIVSLISLLVGLILAFVGAVQLQQFGAEIYVADLVGIAMAREMGAMMTAIIMAGRTGAAFAAQLGTMQVNEEIDALSTLGLPSMDFLVLPRMLALILMMPLLCIYADLMGILGGLIVATGMLDLSVTEYINQTRNGVDLMDFAIGVFKASVFGVLIAVAGCLRGMQCGRSASAVGLATTSAVVTGIVAIIVLDGIFAVLTNILGI